MFTIFVFSFLVYYLSLSFFAYYQIKNIIKFYRSRPNFSYKQNWEGFIRNDFNKWNQRKIIIGCFTRFPLNFSLLGGFLVSFLLMMIVTYPFGKIGNKICIYYGIKFGNFANRIAYNIKEDINYQKYKIITPILISNHISWFDIYYIGLTFGPISFISKQMVRTAPLVGKIADFIQTIYVSRNNQEQRQQVISAITQRVKSFQKQKNGNTKNQVFPLAIFPQGTTSNGKSLLTFKNGAFNDLAPITIITLKYSCQGFSMGMDQIRQTHHVLITLCLRPNLQVSHRVVQPKQGQSVDQYRIRCRNIMSEMTGFKKCQSGYRDSLQLQKFTAQQLKINKNEIKQNKSKKK